MKGQKQFLKKAALISLPILLLLSLMAGCTSEREKDAPDGTQTPDSTAAVSDKTEDSQPPEESEDTPPETEAAAAFPGSYTVPDGWVTLEKYSTKSKIFYAEEGRENDELPDNISIEIGKDRYSADEHEKFRDAIVRQLTRQIQGIDATLAGDGTYTEQDYILYVFTITEEDVVTKQYYIVGDQRYCLVHLTNFTGSEEAVEAARAIADSFVWD